MSAQAGKDNRESQKASANAVLACAWPALLLATACLLPYLNKPFNIDDPLFLTMARQIVNHPTHPMDFDVCWNITSNLGADCGKAYVLAPGNAMMGYVLVPTVLAGAHEWTAHLTQLALVWIAIVAMASLVLRFGWDRWHAIAGALLLVAIPPFLPMASTAMPDILATAVALVAMERLAAWKAEQRWGQGAAAAIALGLAGFARAHLVLLLPLAALYLFSSTRPGEFFGQFRRRFWLWIPVIAGAALLATIIAITREHNLALKPPAIYSGTQHLAINLWSYLLYLVFPLPLGLSWLANRIERRRLRAVIIPAVAAGAAWFLHPWLVWFPALVGFAVLADLLYEALDKAELTDLILLFWVLIPLPIVYYGHLPPKYLLPCMPAVILLCFRLTRVLPVRFFRAAALALILAGTGYSLLMLRSDAEFARFGRDSMYALIAPHVAAGEKVWYGGQYWSYWYAPLAGATLTFPGGPQPKPGDLLVVDGLTGAKQSLAPFPHRTLVEETTHQYRFGRTMGGGAGLYSNIFGVWMWTIGTSDADRFELWRIE